MKRDPAIATAPIELWFDFASTYSYLSIMRIDSLAQACDVPVLWRPFLLGPIFQALGWTTSPFLLQVAKGAYMWRDIERQCRKHRIPWHRPSEFPRRALLPLRVALLCSSEPWIGAFCQRVMQLNFASDRSIDSPEAVTGALIGLAPRPSDLVAAAQLEETKSRLRDQTDIARRRGIFGAPTFIVGEELFWGNDRLEDALALAAAGGALPEGTAG